MQPTGHKETNRLDHVVTNNVMTNKYQLNEAIYNEPKFYTNRFNSYSGTRDPLPVVTFTLRGGKKHGATNVSDITFLCYSVSTNSIIKIKQPKYYEINMWSNKVDNSTAAGVYCTTHDVKVSF